MGNNEEHTHWGIWAAIIILVILTFAKTPIFASG